MSLLLLPLGVASAAYGVAAAILGVLLWALSLTGLRRTATVGWARRYFAATIGYLTLLLSVLVATAS